MCGLILVCVCILLPLLLLLFQMLHSAIFSKMAMNKPQGENMTPPNLYAVLTAMSFVGLLPFTLAIEGSKVAHTATPPILL
jgi:hypothetical protein